jgi:hypothetical protein
LLQGVEQTTGANSIDFYPTGRAQPARVRISTERAFYEIESPSPTEEFRLITQEQPS